MDEFKKQKIKISPDVPLADLAEHYPDIAEYLTDEYGFHCLNCFLSEFETLEDGAATHGIFGDEFEELMEEVNELANTNK